MISECTAEMSWAEYVSGLVTGWTSLKIRVCFIVLCRIPFIALLRLVKPPDVFTRGQFWPSGIVVACVCLSVWVSVCVCVRQPRACPRHKSRRVQARTTKFGQKVQNNLVKVPIVLGGDWHWPSRSNLTWKTKFTPFWACPRHNS